MAKSRQMNRKRLKKTAYHEAGHAVIGYRFGHRYGEITIKPDKGRYGHCRFWVELEDPKEQILLLFAGHAAAKVCAAYRGNPSFSDYAEAIRLLGVMGLSPEAHRKFFQEASSMVTENLKQIQAVAEALLECETLDGGLFACIIEAVDNGLDWRQNKTWIVYKEYLEG